MVLLVTAWSTGLEPRIGLIDELYIASYFLLAAQTSRALMLDLVKMSLFSRTRIIQEMPRYSSRMEL